MTYKEILEDFKKVDLKEKFTFEFENYISKELFVMIKHSDKINSCGSLIRLLLKKYKIDSEDWIFWQKVLIYFMTPDFCKTKIF